MSTTKAAPTPSKTTDAVYVSRNPLPALLATVIAVVATVFTLFDLFANGLAPTLLHLAVGLAVFGVVRLCVGLALDPFFPTEDPESTT
ncbi:hypothetical protein [Streptomyces flavofungini]|uniref:hypothetical protein n=1 Tax=Streptomyces flavofungini TaxID=68200 RepID=UPI0025AFE19F|nr:hypothetical protein [Streptomyces flavofungini]WJV51779.1 hypothetical protein QUY26_39830 [Streptomyces flavofungini]